MRVCLVSSEFAPFQGWGAGTYASLAAAAFAAAGHETHVLSSDRGMIDTGPRVRPGVRFHAIDWDAAPLRWDGWPTHPVRHAMGVFHALRKLHAAHPFDYIEFPDFGGEGFFVTQARRAWGEFPEAVLGVRLHSATRELWALNGRDWLDRERAVLCSIEDATTRAADILIAPSRAMLDLLRPRLGDVIDAPDRTVVAVHNPFDFALLEELGGVPHAADPDARAAGEPTGPAEVVFIGRLEERKGVRLLVRAARRVLDAGIDVRFRLIGGDTCTGPYEGSMLDHLRDQLGPLADRFIFDGRRTERRLLGRAVRRAACCVFPSVWENFPYACLEAMALGACVVGSDAGGMAEMIEPPERNATTPSGLLFRSGDEASLAEALKRALTDVDLRRRCGVNAPLRVREICDPLVVTEQAVDAIERARIRLRARHAIHAAGPSPAADGRAVAADDEGVTVIIPVFNTHRFLDAAIASVERQTCRPAEIICIDDGSTDPATIDALDRLAAGGRVRLVRQHNRGLSGARNAGFAAAATPWVVPLDADDMLRETFIERTLATARRLHRETGSRPSYVTSLLECFQDGTGDGDPVLTGPDGGDEPFLFVPLGPDRELLPVINVAGSCVALFDRGAVLGVGGYDESLRAYEDWDLYCSLAERWSGGEGSSAGLVVPEALVLNRVRATSMLRSITRRQHELLRAGIMGRHPALSTDPGRTLRLLQSELRSLPEHGGRDALSAEVYAVARRIIDENLRYRAADRVNDILKRVGIQRAMKRWIARGG
jgi:glycosyltransferase involved in cell wall biosynthesis